MRHWMRHPRWRHFGRLLVSRRRPSALRRLQLSSTTDRFIIPKKDAASGARWRRQMNERVWRRNAWVVGRNDLAHCPWPDTCPTSMYVGGSEKGVQTATPRSQLVESDRTRSNLAAKSGGASGATRLPRRGRGFLEDISRTSQDISGDE